MDIIQVPLAEFKNVKKYYTEVKKNLKEHSIDQWDRYYPNAFVLFEDLRKRQFFGIKENRDWVGMIVLNTEQSKQYEDITWEDGEGMPLVVHRLAVHPNFQGQGIGKILLSFAEEYALKKGFTSIRLDVYTGNPGAVALYQRSGYNERGTVNFPFRRLPFYCFEKVFS